MNGKSTRGGREDEIKGNELPFLADHVSNLKGKLFLKMVPQSCFRSLRVVLLSASHVGAFFLLGVPSFFIRTELGKCCHI